MYSIRKSAVEKLAPVSLLMLSACGGGSDEGDGNGNREVRGESNVGASPINVGVSPINTQTSTAEPDTPFVDVTEASNISYRVGYTRPYLFMGTRAISDSTIGGAAAGDCDGDGDIDLFLTYGNTSGRDGGGGPNRLYLNQFVEQGNGLLFEDIAEQAGVANTRPDGRNDRHSGPTFADMDGDGDLDIFLGGIFSDPNKIYENDGNCQFADVTSSSPDIVDMIAAHTLSAAFGDYDLDGDLDMFLTHWGTNDRDYGTMVDGAFDLLETDHLFRNESDESGIRYVNVSEESGISDMTWSTRSLDVRWEQDADFTFTATFARINSDVWPDIAIAADFWTTQLALNYGDGTFLNIDQPDLPDTQFGMGSALGDIDNDGDLDWFITGVFGPGDELTKPYGNRFWTNAGSGLIDDTDRLGVRDGSWGWAACFLDLDNDTDLDIYHTNGWEEPFLVPEEDYRAPTSRAFVMNDAGTYENRADELGLAEATSGRGLVCADFDHDGDTDIFELTDAPGNSARLWENRSAAEGRNFLRVRLEGLPPNTEAAGARIFAQTGDKRQMREIMIGSNYTSQNPTVQIFGLGDLATVDEILVEWPALDSADGPVQLGSLLTGPIAASQPGQTLVIRHPELP